MNSRVIAVAPIARRQPIFINGFILPALRLQSIHRMSQWVITDKIHNDHNKSAFGLNESL
jgi:hypothetical protein